MLFMRYSISLFSSRTSFIQSDVMSLLLLQDIFWLRPEQAVVAEICKLSLFFMDVGNFWIHIFAYEALIGLFLQQGEISITMLQKKTSM